MSFRLQNWQGIFFFFLALRFLFLAVSQNANTCKNIVMNLSTQSCSVRPQKIFALNLVLQTGYLQENRRYLLTLCDVVWPFWGSQWKLCSIQHTEFTSGLRVNRSISPYRESWVCGPHRDKSFRPWKKNCAASKTHWDSPLGPELRPCLGLCFFRLSGLASLGGFVLNMFTPLITL